MGGRRTGQRRDFPERAGQVPAGKTSDAAEEDQKENTAKVSTARCVTCSVYSGSHIEQLFRQVVREAATICPRPCKLTFDLLTLKVVSESGVSWATSVPVLVFLGLSALDLGPMYATDRRQMRILA